MSFLSAVFASAGLAARQPMVLAPSALAVIGSHLAYRALGVEGGFWNLPQASMPPVVVIVVAQFWVTVSVLTTALAALREPRQRRGFLWVSPTTASRRASSLIGPRGADARPSDLPDRAWRLARAALVAGDAIILDGRGPVRRRGW
jgi:hypothetical protein